MTQNKFERAAELSRRLAKTYIDLYELYSEFPELNELQPESMLPQHSFDEMAASYWAAAGAWSNIAEEAKDIAEGDALVDLGENQ